MDGDSRLSWLFIAALLAVAAFFALAATAVTSVSRIRLKTRADRGERSAEKALFVLDHFDEAISAMLIGTNIVHLTIATLVTLMVRRTWGAGWVALGTILCTVTVFFAGEMLPKSIGKRYSERCALAAAPSLCFFMRIFAPLARALTVTGEAFSRLFKGEPEVTVTEDELYDIIETMTDEGELDQERGELIHSALEFGDVTVEHVFTPRVDLTALDVNATSQQVLDTIRRCRHSRLPVYEGSIDNVVGVLQIRRYLRAYLRGDELPGLRSMMDEPCFVHESASVDELLEELNRRKLSIAVVTDNYGGTAGIITVEDILEELVGEIWDEHDEIVEEFKQQPDGSYLISCSANLDDLFDRFNTRAVDIDSASISGWVLDQLERLPVEGDRFVYENLDVTVTKVDHRRILEIRVAVIPEEEPSK